MIPANSLSSTVLVSPFLPPRTNIRFGSFEGKSDSHYGGIANGDASQGIQYQLWTVNTDGVNIYLSAPNTPPFAILSGVNPVWVALAIDQSARVFIAWATINGVCSYYWYDTTILGYRTSVLPRTVFRPFAVLDDNRVAQINQSDVIFAYVNGGTLYYRQQRDRFGVEYTLGAAPATLVQLGMNLKWRLQFAFQNVQGSNVLPPVEFQLNTDGAINV